MDSNSTERQKIMRMVTERMKRHPSPTPQPPLTQQQQPTLAQSSLLKMVSEMQKQINHLNSVILNIQNNSNDSILSQALEKKDRELEMQREKVSKNEKQIEELIQENYKRVREIQYLRLEMSRSYSSVHNNSATDIKINFTEDNILGAIGGNQSGYPESFMAKVKTRVPKKTIEPIVSPLEMSLVKENLVIEESKAFEFDEFQ